MATLSPSQKSSSWVNFPKHLSLSLQEYLLYLFACLKTIPDDSITCRVKCKLSQLARCECKSESKIFAFYFVSFSEGEKLTKRRGLQKNWKKVAPLSLPPCPTTLPRPPLNGIANWLWFPPPLQVKAEKNWTCSKRQVRWCKVEIQGVPASALSRVRTLCCSVDFDLENLWRQKHQYAVRLLSLLCGGHCYSEKKKIGSFKTVSVSFKMLFQTKNCKSYLHTKHKHHNLAKA